MKLLEIFGLDESRHNLSDDELADYYPDAYEQAAKDGLIGTGQWALEDMPEDPRGPKLVFTARGSKAPTLVWRPELEPGFTPGATAALDAAREKNPIGGLPPARLVRR